MTMPGAVSPSADHRRFVEDDSDDSRSSCSLGRDSDDEDGCVDFEAESSNGGKMGPLGTMDSLEEALPTKRGISKFYQGKSKSFTSLTDATSASSIKEFAKPEIPFARKRNPQRNPLARTSSDNLRARVSGISTKTADNCGSLLVPDFSPRSSDKEDSYSMLMQSSSCRPPLHPLAKKPTTSISRMRSLPQNFNCRSFSLSDIRCMASASSKD